MKRSLLLGAICLLMTTLSFAQVEDIARRLGLGGSTLSDTKHLLGPEAGSADRRRASSENYRRTQRIFCQSRYKNSECQTTCGHGEKGLRMVGYGPKVDDFVLSMNTGRGVGGSRGAQNFIDAITAMTFEDARSNSFPAETPQPPTISRRRPRPS
jgi:hypothetical protein